MQHEHRTRSKTNWEMLAPELLSRMTPVEISIAWHMEIFNRKESASSSLLRLFIYRKTVKQAEFVDVAVSTQHNGVTSLCDLSIFAICTYLTLLSFAGLCCLCVDACAFTLHVSAPINCFSSNRKLSRFSDSGMM